jgi:UDP-N-acetylglucosamine 2-epimerase (non-hydrolysing)
MQTLAKKKKILLVFGTRPEAIKMAPLIKILQKHAEKFDILVCVTGQHREMLDQVLNIFDIKPDFDLNIMQRNQDLYDVTNKVLLGMREILATTKPDLVLVHGDTTTSMAAALASYYQQIDVGHVEAGLRTQNKYSPWPEELNRQITGRISKYHFTPTELNKNNLLAENVDLKSIFVTGNTIIDALNTVTLRINSDTALQNEIKKELLKCGYDSERLNNNPLILITGHRRENFGEGFDNICNALRTLSEKYPYVDFVYPVHPNPNVREPINRILGESTSKNVFLIEPLDYLPFVFLMQRCKLLLTDSGGIQEEATAIRKPLLVMRETTERPEAVLAGAVKLVGTDYELIVNEVSRLVEDNGYYKNIENQQSPYGDGNAAEKIVQILMNVL